MTEEKKSEFQKGILVGDKKKQRALMWTLIQIGIALLIVVACTMFIIHADNKADEQWYQQCTLIGGTPSSVPTNNNLCVMGNGTYVSQR
jgi:flagellar basal body-associated protein FliL